MAGVNYARMSRAEVEKALLGIAASTWPHDVPEYAIRGILAFNEMQATGLSTANFASYVTTLAAYLDVPMPAVPADLSALNDAQLRTLAASMDLAFWDFVHRGNALGYCQQYWRKHVDAGGTPPTILQYRDMFLTVANYTRARRGLAALTA